MAENVHLLEVPMNIPIDTIHQSTKAIEGLLGTNLLDIVPAYDSIGIFSKLAPDALIHLLENTHLENSAYSNTTTVQIIPICYELGLDLDLISAHSGLSIEQVINIHSEGTYRSLFYGFTPGFIYADGLDGRLACPRKENPRTHVAAGSVGIGGAQTGIYSLESPGGWNILGRTPLQLFDPNNDPPVIIDVGSSYRFKRISQKAFEEWGS